MAAATEGKFDTAAGWRAALPNQEILTNLVTTNTSTQWVRVFDIWTVLTIFVYAQIRIARLAATIQGAVLGYLIGEVLAPSIPGDRVLDQANADARVVNDVIGYFPITGHGMTNAELQAAAGLVPAAQTGNISAATDFSVTDQQAHTVVQNVDDAWCVCQVIARHRYRMNSANVLTTIYVTFLMSVAKMGNVSDHMMDKISDRIMSEIKIRLDGQMYRQDIISVVWDMIGNFISETNIAFFIGRWVGADGTPGIIPAYALCLRTMVNQIKGEGLTSLNVIKKAMLELPNFYWNAVAALYPAEMVAVTNAAKAVGDNPYFGFIKNNDAVKSTKYKNVAWVAKTILIRSGGNDTLDKYKGFITTPRNNHQVRDLIDNYFNALPGLNVTQAHATSADEALDELTKADGIMIN